MLTQFRSHYPQGSIVSDLVTVEHGQYIVRTLIQVEGVTLASGLAAADTVEQAEDRARERSLALLNLSAPVSTPAPLRKPMAQSPPPAPSTDTEPSEASLESKVTSRQNGFLPQPEPEPESPVVEETEMEAIPPTPALDPPKASRFSFGELESSEPLPQPTPTPTHQWSDPVQPDVPIDAQAVAEDQSVAVEPEMLAQGPIDFSDVIAKTNVEMKRLGWTNEQGRKYLLETYGKRSRQLLSDEELLDFLRYLESLSA